MKSVVDVSEVTMTLKDITDLVGVRHDKAIIKVLELEKEQGFGQVSRMDICIAKGNGATQTISTLVLNKKQAIAAAARLNNSALMMVVNRLEELEAANQAPHFEIPQTLPDALRLAAQLAEEKQQALEKIKIKDQLLIAVADLNIRAGDIPVGQFAKNLAIKELGPNNMFKWLRARGFLRDNNEPYQPYVNRGYFNWKPYDEKINGEVKHQTMITPRGQAWVTRMIRTEYELGDSA
jgi:phage antirepressor YoqD-like protein